MLSKRSNEVLLDNFIDKELEALLFPINIPCYIFLQPKYTIKSSFITPNGYFSVFISLFCVCFVIVSQVLRNLNQMFNYKDFRNLSFILRFIPYFDTLFYIFGFITCFAITYYQSTNLVDVIVKIQRSHRVFNFVKNKSFNELISYNWVCFGLFVLYNIIFFSGCYYFEMLNVYGVIQGASLMYFDWNVIYAICVVKTLKFELDLWMAELRLFSKSQTSGAYFKEHCKKMAEAYVDIMSAFRGFARIFQVQIFFHTSEIFIHSLFYVQFCIDIGKLDHEGDFIFDTHTCKLVLQLTSWVAKNFFILTTIGLEFDRFYTTVEGVEKECSAVLKMETWNDSLKLVCKNVSRVRVACFSRMSACGVFSVDASLVLRLLQLVATYTVVLLQFAFL